MKFPIADKLTLPDNAVTQTFGLFGRKGSGKTYAAGVLAESFLLAGVQTVILDPVGNWYGLRLSKTGKTPSEFKIPILGGEHGDVPLAATAGALIAQTIVNTGTSAVLDVSHFRKADRKRFMADFAEELFHRKKTNRSPMHLIIEEAQLFAPQAKEKGEERMLGAIEDLVRLGRNYGIGATMISQRPQSVNTEVRNQCEPLIVFQLVAKHERDAVAGWMQHMGVNSDLEGLSKLKTGECFFWSPAWLDKFVRTHFKEKVSFDASSTPTTGSVQSGPKKLQSLDLGKLQEAMAATIQEAKANDPVELKKRIAQLEREAKSKGQITVVDQSAIDKAVAVRDRHWQSEIGKLLKDRNEKVTRLQKIEQLAHLNGAATVAITEPALQHVSYASEPKPIVKLSAPRSTPSDNASLGGGALRMIQVLADRAPAKFTEAQWATLAKLKRTGGTWSTYKSRLLTNGYVEKHGDLWSATEAGIAEFGDAGRAPQSADEIREQWKSRLGTGPARMIDALVNANGALDRSDLAEVCELTAGAGTFSTYLSRLRSNGLVTVSGSTVELSDLLQD
jgi:uncharacterized protein